MHFSSLVWLVRIWILQSKIRFSWSVKPVSLAIALHIVSRYFLCGLTIFLSINIHLCCFIHIFPIFLVCFYTYDIMFHVSWWSSVLSLSSILCDFEKNILINLMLVQMVWEKYVWQKQSINLRKNLHHWCSYFL